MNKRKPFGTIDEYIGSFPKDTQRILQTFHREIKSAAPQAAEAISYGIPTFKLNGNLVHFAAFKNHIGFYPTPSAIAAFKKELSPYKTSKGAIQFPIDEPMPLALISWMVKFRVKENLGKEK
ncbi:MAG: iron chaperone [Limisphaerales bacterium]